MDSNTVNKWLTLGANVGILIGLALVVFEIRQNADLLRLQFINDDLLISAQTESPMLGEDPTKAMMKAMYTPEDLTYAEFRTVDAYLVSKMDLLTRRYILGQEGILEQSAWESNLGFTFEWLFGNKFSRLWWQHEGRRAYGDFPEIVEYIDEAIIGLSDDTTIRGWEEIQSELKSQAMK
jgi:hypothetical protein